MNVSTRLTLFTAIIVLLLSQSPARGAKPAEIVPNLRPFVSQALQPFAGQVAFVGSPGYARVCSVSVNLSSLKKLPSAETFRFQKQDAYGFAVAPDSSAWPAPVDSGATIKFLYTFRPEQVGTYQLSFGRRLNKRWITLATLMLAIDEDGKTVYAGAAEYYRLNLVPPHCKRDSEPLTVRFPLWKSEFDPALDRPITATFKFSPPPKLNETTFVDFELECQLNLYSKVQFVLDYSTSLKPSELPASWGDSAGPNPDYRFYRGRFAIVPQKAGIGYLDFKVIGKRPLMKQSERITTDFPIYFVIGSDNQLLFIGDFDPWTRFKDKTDPLLATAAALVDVKDRDYRLKQALSQPDFLGQETEAKEKASAKVKDK
jgi:hypothetical protein